MSLAHNIFYTSLGRKYLMAFTGAGLFGFVVMHMLGNLTIFAGPAAINEYAAKLHSLGPLLWAARIGLLGMATIHIWAAIKLSSENKKARLGDRQDWAGKLAEDASPQLESECRGSGGEHELHSDRQRSIRPAITLFRKGEGSGIRRAPWPAQRDRGPAARAH